MSNTIEVKNMDSLAQTISGLYDTWDKAREPKKQEWSELQSYLYATDTSTTSNSDNGWSNSTTLPKLTQIMENLLANHYDTLFPNDDWLDWQAGDELSLDNKKKNIILSVMKDKTSGSDFRKVIKTLLYDWIIYGNAFASVEFVKEEFEDEKGEKYYGYIGPKVVRHSPNDIVFNPLATDFNSSPKIIRKIKTVGDIFLDYKNKPELNYLKSAIDNIINNRQQKKSASEIRYLDKHYNYDGFGSAKDYLNSGYVEIFEFYGNILDLEKGELHENIFVSIADKTEILKFEEIRTWNKQSYYKHIGWRTRPDNLWAMGPLDNLVGLQYRIDHLENLKADVLDLIAFPVMKIKGDVDWEGWAPGSEAYLGPDGDIDVLRVDSEALRFDSQINMLEAKMEQYAGAPREAMGIRTPGEKTAYEIQTLQNASSRIFSASSKSFEQDFLEPILNQMFEVYRRNLEGADIVRVIDEEYGVEEFLTITKDDLSYKGKFKPIGARHFSERARFTQEITQFYLGMAQDPSVKNHISGKAIAKIFSENLNLDKIGGYGENINIIEQIESQQVATAAQQQLQQESMVNPGVNLDVAQQSILEDEANMKESNENGSIEDILRGGM